MSRIYLILSRDDDYGWERRLAGQDFVIIRSPRHASLSAFMLILRH